MLRDRIVQEALRSILDPIYETDFQPHSYGFRKGRSTMDAIAAMMPYFNQRVKHYYVIEGDIKGYFDAVHHRKLMSILKRRIGDKDILALIWTFLKAGVMDGGLFAHTEMGVPQGGVISPLLANVYLNEFDTWAADQWGTDRNTKRKRRVANLGNYQLIRYADDFVIVSNGGIADVRATKEVVKHYLHTELHLELSEEKTVITHVNAGFNFLGFHLQRKRPEGRWVVHLRPTEQGKDRVKRKIKDLTSNSWTWMDEYTRLTTLNALVRGWSTYYRHTSLLADIADISRYVWFRYLGWLQAKHKGKGKHRLIQEKARVLHQRKRWIAQIREGGKVLTAYQWCPTQVELKRSHYFRKGKNGFPHPYLLTGTVGHEDYPLGLPGPREVMDKRVIGLPDDARQRNEPQDMSERKLRAKVRDDFACVQCGAKGHLRVHHIKGTKSHRIEDLETLCQDCHYQKHGGCQ
ncbi:MAG: HNH endonuclease [Ktedonobacteraceae bacterium]|nr:HNH endonuclease [Ktedonobacteraceae bacterium]